MIPILCGYHISFCYFFALEMVRGHDFWGTFENVLENIWLSVNIEELTCEWWNGVLCGIDAHCNEIWYNWLGESVWAILLADWKNQPIGLLCVTHILQFCGYFKGQEQFGFNPTSWHLVTYNILWGHIFWWIIRSMTTSTFLS